MLKQCLRCGQDFKVVPAIAHKRMHCSRECRTRAGQVELVCEWCKSKFDVVVSRVKANRGKHCSRECRTKAGSREIVCETCGKKVRRDKNEINAKFCSPICHYDFERGRKKPSKNRVKKICEYCRTVFDINKYRHNEGKGRFCSKRCYKIGYVQTEDTKCLLRIARSKQVLPTKNTRLEQIMKGLLDSLGIRYEMQHYVSYGDNKRGGNFDFAILDKKIAIECDGMYWHCKDNNIAADRRKKEFCMNNGWTLLRFIDTQITKDLRLCREKIAATIKKTRYSQIYKRVSN